MFDFFKKKKSTEEEVIAVVEEQDYVNITPVAEYFKDETGVSFDKQISVLTNKVTTFCKHRNIHSFSKLLEIIENDSIIKQELIDYLTTNETFFYREFKQIEDLVKLIKEKRSHVTVLCAPSATGEEPYSIAIALLEAGVLSKDFNIVGIDINSDAIEKSKEAIYKTRNVRNLSEDIIKKYFTHDNDKYILSESVKSLVSFKLTNLFDDF